MILLQYNGHTVVAGVQGLRRGRPKIKNKAQLPRNKKKHGMPDAWVNPSLATA